VTDARCGRLTDIEFFGHRHEERRWRRSMGLISERYHRATKSILSKLFIAIHLLQLR
jgi:hypothetical protein